MRFYKSSLLVFFLLFTGSSWVMAQDAATPVTEVPSTNNMLAIVLVIISLVFAFVIFGMGQVLLQLIRQVMAKSRQEKIVAGLLIIGFMCTGNGLFAQDTALTEAVTVVPNYGGLSATAFWVLVSVIGIEVIAIFCMLFFINRIQQELVPAPAKAAGISLITMASGNWIMPYHRGGSGALLSPSFLHVYTCSIFMCWVMGSIPNRSMMRR